MRFKVMVSLYVLGLMAFGVQAQTQQKEVLLKLCSDRLTQLGYKNQEAVQFSSRCLTLVQNASTSCPKQLADCSLKTGDELKFCENRNAIAKLVMDSCFSVAEGQIKALQ